MVNTYWDLTNDYNNNSGVINIEIGSYNYMVAHIITNSATITFKASNDGNEIAGSSLGSTSQATNFIAVQGTNLATGTAATSITATSAPGTLWQFGVVGRYFQFSGSGTVGKLLIQLSKIQ